MAETDWYGKGRDVARAEREQGKTSSCTPSELAVVAAYACFPTLLTKSEFAAFCHGYEAGWKEVRGKA